ncbi:TrmH family RNA methyltransferase [Puteibacter caeruleilacunae]|nr:TrmH family RNA methyltransferase [Puteibacter caeruleilacunae]
MQTRNTNSISFFKDQEYQLPNHIEGPIVIGWRINTPNNIGSIIRLADNVGASRVIIVNNDPKRASSIKKTAGNSYDKMPWEFCTEEEFFALIPPQYQLVAIETADRSTNIFTTSLPINIGIMVGAEKHGIPESVLEKCHQVVHIPMTGNCKSMNVSHALAVALFEWQRQAFINLE